MKFNEKLVISRPLDKPKLYKDYLREVGYDDNYIKNISKLIDNKTLQVIKKYKIK